jgi:hypothetical protein
MKYSFLRCSTLKNFQLAFKQRNVYLLRSVSDAVRAETSGVSHSKRQVVTTAEPTPLKSSRLLL